MKAPASPGQPIRQRSARRLGSPRSASRQVSAPVLLGPDIALKEDDTAKWQRERERRAREREDTDRKEKDRDRRIHLQQERRNQNQAIVQARHAAKEAQGKVNRTSLKLDRSMAEIDRLAAEKSKKCERFDRMMQELMAEKQNVLEDFDQQLAQAEEKQQVLVEEHHHVKQQSDTVEYELKVLEEAWEANRAESFSPQQRSKGNPSVSPNKSRQEPTRGPTVYPLVAVPTTTYNNVRIAPASVGMPARVSVPVRVVPNGAVMMPQQPPVVYTALANGGMHPVQSMPVQPMVSPYPTMQPQRAYA